MSFFSKSSGKKHYGGKHKGSKYYKREGILSRILRMFGSFSSSDRKHNSHYSDRSHHKRRRYKSSWS